MDKESSEGANNLVKAYLRAEKIEDGLDVSYGPREVASLTIATHGWKRLSGGHDISCSASSTKLNHAYASDYTALKQSYFLDPKLTYL